MRLIIDVLPSLATALLFYKFYYSTYPGGALNFIFYSAYQGIDYTMPTLVRLSGQHLGYELQVLDQRLSLGEAMKLLLNWDSLAFVFNIWMLKISIMLGFVHEKLFQSEREFFATKIWRSLTFVFLTLPGFYSLPVLAISRAISRQETLIYLWSLLFVLSNSLLQGDPRYLMGTYFIVILALIRMGYAIFKSSLFALKA